MKGDALLGQEGVFTPLIKEFLKEALDGELEARIENEFLNGDIPKVKPVRFRYSAGGYLHTAHSQLPNIGRNADAADGLLKYFR